MRRFISVNTRSILFFCLLSPILSSSAYAENRLAENFRRNLFRNQRSTGTERLDAPYPKYSAPIGIKQRQEAARPRPYGPTPLDVIRERLPNASPTLQTIAMQTPVKSQGSRGACSIFSATALLEAMLIRQNPQFLSIDLSEQWLEYLATRFKSSDGSHSYSNFSYLFQYGSPMESTMPYNMNNWKDIGLADPRAASACGNVPSNLLTGCLIAQRDPRLLEMSDRALNQADPAFLRARNEAAQLKLNHLRLRNPNLTIKLMESVEEVKSNLAQGIPLTLDMSFHYGAWNHRKATELGIPRNQEHWEKGFIFYPVPGSVDLENSRKAPAGHSVVVVGYDDDVVIKRIVEMTDGSQREFAFKGVYYIKNSWGANNFGVDAQLNGQAIPGYGTMVQQYAHDFGEFFKMPLGE